MSITGFGVFEKVHRSARVVRNPRTGERKQAEATAIPRFRAGTDLKAYVAGEKEVPPTEDGPTNKKAAGKRQLRQEELQPVRLKHRSPPGAEHAPGGGHGVQPLTGPQRPVSGTDHLVG